MVNGVLPTGTNQNGTEQRHLRNKLHCKCISFSREVINANYIVEEYANLATIFITIITNISNEQILLSFRVYFMHINHADVYVLCPVVFDFAGPQSLGNETITDA